MFKKSSAANEIFEAMQVNENDAAFAKLTTVENKKIAAMEQIHKAAELFEKAGHAEEAKKLTRLIIAISAADQKKKS